MSLGKSKLLERDQFRDAVFQRDGGCCVFCEKKAKDAHHILERRLWPDGGYYLDNGASVCEEHHMKCETTEISVEDVRLACGIKKIIVPPHLYPDQPYDKWGNPIWASGQRSPGELFNDASVQKILKEGGVLHLFTPYVKYGRTHHLPWSPGVHDDDCLIESMNPFMGRRVIVTEKMDGENTSIYNNYIHARSVDGRSHPSRSWVKSFAATQVSPHLPDQWRLCGENLYALHSIAYQDLESYFMGFSMWDEKNNCLSWDDTQIWFNLLGVVSVPILYDDIYDEKKIKKLWASMDEKKSEGYVLRLADSFSYRDFKTSVAKFVRPNHVQTVKHWMYGQAVVKNHLKLESPKLKIK